MFAERTNVDRWSQLSDPNKPGTKLDAASETDGGQFGDSNSAQTVMHGRKQQHEGAL